jgi:hypothetical protein
MYETADHELFLLQPTKTQLISQQYIAQQYHFISYILLHVSTFLCHHQGVPHLCLAKVHKFLKLKLLKSRLCKLARHKCKTPR